MASDSDNVGQKEGPQSRRQGILLRRVRRDEITPAAASNSAGVMWVEGEADLYSLGLSTSILESLVLFWRGHDALCFLPLEEAGILVAERLAERRSLLVFGAGHVGFSVAMMGVMIGFDVLLIDDREEFLQRAASIDSNIRPHLCDFNDVTADLKVSKNSAIVIVTRGHQCDEVILRQVANYDSGYVGMIGSRRRVEGVFRRLRQQGVSDSFLNQVKAPIGLDIGAKTPQEIAVSIHAEIIRHFNGANF